jgi:hypothetical protein
MRVFEIVVLADQLIPPRLFLRQDQPHVDLIQDRGFGRIDRTVLLVSHPGQQNKFKPKCPAPGLTSSFATIIPGV